MGYKFPKREIGVILGGLVHPWLGGMLKEKYDAENRAPQDKANAAATNNIMEAASNPAMNASNGLMLSNIPQSVSTQRRSPESDRADGRTMFDAQPSLLNPNGSGPNIDPLVVPKDMNFQRRATPNGWVTDGDMTETKFLPEGGPPQQSLMPQPFTRTPQQSPLMNTQGYSQPENRQLQGPPNKATQDVRRAIEQGLRSTQAGQRPMNKNEFNGAPQTRPTAAAVEGYNPLGSIERNNYATQQLGRMGNLNEGQKLQVERSLAQMAPKEAPTTVDVYNERTGLFERASNAQIAASPWLRPTAAAPKDKNSFGAGAFGLAVDLLNGYNAAFDGGDLYEDLPPIDKYKYQSALQIVGRGEPRMDPNTGQLYYKEGDVSRYYNPPAAQKPSQQPATPPVTPLTAPFIDDGLGSNINLSETSGFPGYMTNAANTFIGLFGAKPWNESAALGTKEFESMSQSSVTALASEVDGRPLSMAYDDIKKIVPQPNQVFESEYDAQNAVKSLLQRIEEETFSMQSIIAAGARVYGKKAVSDARLKRDLLEKESRKWKRVTWGDEKVRKPLTEIFGE